MLVMTYGKKRAVAPKKFLNGKPCPDPLKGERCKLCGMTYVCKATPKARK